MALHFKFIFFLLSSTFMLKAQKKASLPMSVSLRAYCPKPQHQGNVNSCTAWATTYGALTITRAAQSGVTNPDGLQRMSHSAAFVYNQFVDTLRKKPCETSLSLRTCLEFLRDSGACLVSSFGNANDCTQKADSSAWREASKYKIKYFFPFYNPKGDSIKKVNDMKQCLAKKKPVVISMNITPSFQSLPKGTIFWQKRKDEPILPNEHAVVIVGYNETEQSFELMNSWGTDWGDGGFAKISYSDFIHLTLTAFKLMMKDE